MYSQTPTHHFITAEERALMSPSSSPETSPDPFGLSGADSSPVSSPSLEPLELDEPDKPRFDKPSIEHPFAGSTHATRSPPMYERPASRDFLVYGNFKSPERGGFVTKPVSPPRVLVFDEDWDITRRAPVLDEEESIWQDKITYAIDAAKGRIDLIGEGLTYIPSQIGDLANLVLMPALDAFPSPAHTTRTFSRSHTTPATRLEREALFSASHPLGGQDGLMLFLSANQIRSLPIELFSLQNLVVLSLRNNALTYIPPQIAQLRALRELNVANNRIAILPAELTALRLDRLSVTPNPLLPVPSPAEAKRLRTRTVGPTTRILGRVPPLSELILRYLISPSAPASPSNPNPQSILAQHFQLPLLDSLNLRPDFTRVLSASVPGAVALPSPSRPRRHPRANPHVPSDPDTTGDNDEADGAVVGMSHCPAPHHGHFAQGDVGQNLPEGQWTWNDAPYAQCAENRIVWVEYIAGHKVGSGAYRVPLLWRGCGVGCLDFLEVEEEEKAPFLQQAQRQLQQEQDAVEDADMSSADEDTDVTMAEA